MFSYISFNACRIYDDVSSFISGIASLGEGARGLFCFILFTPLSFSRSS